ncbi:MAG: Gfo/Idh/MocA family oxidoreductase [Anaerohalosphaeraceae bacterium]|nr:Gfo/Idh/MocA family oxidoreductase [Anaerohalosphaeraceae bacterium]
MIRIATVGTSGYAYSHIERLWSLEKIYELVAVSDSVSKSTGADECRERGIPVYDSVDDMLVNIQGKCDVVLVATPIHTHFEIAKKCIEAGFDVFLEKPPVATIQDLDNLALFAKSKGKNIAVAFQYLYSSIVKQLKARIVAGEFGTVKRVKGMAGSPRFDSYYNRNNWAGKIRADNEWVLDGTINNPLAHMLANELYFASMEAGKMAEPVTVQAELYHGHNIESEDTSSLRIITTDDVEVIFNASLCSDMKIDTTITIECENATIEYVSFGRATITRDDGSVEQLNDSSHKGINMLEKLADTFEAKKPYAATLEICRPFTLCVNGAFESCGGTYGIDKKYVKTFESDDLVKTVIEDIDSVLQTAHLKGKLFSEIDVSWAQKSKPFDLSDYKQFPTGIIS